MSVYDYILALLHVAKVEKAEVTATKLQKIFFIMEKEKSVNLGLNFKPYLFGPYSEKLQNSLYELVDKGLVKINYDDVKNLAGTTVGYKESYELEKDIKIDVSEEVLSFFRQWVKKNRNEILEYVYGKYPEYIEYSLIKDKFKGNTYGK